MSYFLFQYSKKSQRDGGFPIQIPNFRYISYHVLQKYVFNITVDFIVLAFKPIKLEVILVIIEGKIKPLPGLWLCSIHSVFDAPMEKYSGRMVLLDLSSSHYYKRNLLVVHLITLHYRVLLLVTSITNIEIEASNIVAQLGVDASQTLLEFFVTLAMKSGEVIGVHQAMFLFTSSHIVTIVMSPTTLVHIRTVS